MSFNRMVVVEDARQHQYPVPATELGRNEGA